MRSAVSLALSLCVALAPHHARADDASPAAVQALYKDAKALAVEATAEHDPAKYELARQKFLQVYAMSHRPNALLSVALAERDLHRAPDAARHLRQFLRLPDARPENVRQARDELAKLQSSLSTLAVTAPAGATISVDGATEDDVAPLRDPLDLPPGHHTIEARLNTLRAAKDVDLAAGASDAVVLEPAPPAAPVATPPPAALAISPPPVADSAHEAPASAASARDGARTVVLVATAGTTLVAAGLAVGFDLGAGSASRRQNEYASTNTAYACAAASSPACSGWNDAARAHARDANLAAGFGVAAGVSAVAFVGTLIFWPQAGSAPARAGMNVRVAPALGPSSGGGIIWGQF